jgi:protein gp37
MWDWNTPGVSLQELWPIVEKTRECPQHTFQILSKYPKGYVRFDFPPNVWLGTSISRTGEFYRVQQLRQAANGNLCFVSIEPIMEAIQHNFTREEIDWVIVGQETGHRKEKILARKKWIDALIANARAESVPIYIKDSIVDALGASYKIEEFPNRL